MRERYFLRQNDDPEREVDRETFRQAERDAGFHPKRALSRPDGSSPLATGGFTASGPRGKVRGRIASGAD